MAAHASTQDVGAGRTPRRRRVGTVAAVACVAATLLVAACSTPPPAAPTVRPQPADRGKVASVTVAPSAGCTAATAPTPPAGRSTITMSFGGATRTALVTVPTAPATDPRPLLVSLHPFVVPPQGWEDYSGLANAAAARGYIVVSPLGSDPGPRWAVPGGLNTGVDDIGFVSALMDRIEDGTCVDRNREVAAGFSAGAAMAQALSCTLPWRMAAVAGSGGTNLTSLCPDSPGTDVLVLHGSADPIAPPTGSNTPFATPLGLDVTDVVATDAARAGCSPTPVTTQPSTSVVQQDFAGCTDGRRVQYRSMIGAGHTWAGTTNVLLQLVGGSTNQDFSATSYVLDFFDAHTTV